MFNSHNVKLLKGPATLFPLSDVEKDKESGNVKTSIPFHYCQKLADIHISSLSLDKLDSLLCTPLMRCKIFISSTRKKNLMSLTHSE